jgi:MFS family permease
VRALLAHRDFRLLIGGQALSAIGDRVVLVALALYVTEIGTPTDVGLVLAAATLPLVVFLVLGGVWADRLPRNKVMIGADLARAALHTLLAVLIFTGSVEIWQIVVIEACFGSAEAFFRPALTGLTPQTVPEELVQPAKAAMQTVEMLSTFVGPALATALVFGAGAGWAFAVDAATFVLSAALLLPIRPRRRGEVVLPESMLRDLRTGWTAVRTRPWVWGVIGAFSISLLFSWAPWITLGPTEARAVHGDPAVYGIVATVSGVGTLAGSVLGFRWRPRHPLRAGMLWALPWPAAVVWFAAGAPLWVVFPAFFIGGFGMALLMVWWETALAQRIPPHLLSRVSSYDWMGSLALVPVGYVLAGPLGEALGVTEVLIGGAVIAIAAQAAGLLVREVRTLPQNSATPSSGVEA